MDCGTLISKELCDYIDERSILMKTGYLLVGYLHTLISDLGPMSCEWFISVLFLFVCFLNNFIEVKLIQI